MSTKVNDTFKDAFHDWLVGKGWKEDEPFFKNDKGWFVLVGMKKVHLPDIFSEYSNLLQINTDTPK